MKIKDIEINNFKNFKRLVIKDIPKETRLVVLIGPNGTGKTSLLEAFNFYQQQRGFLHQGDKGYFAKNNGVIDSVDVNNLVKISFHDCDNDDLVLKRGVIRKQFYFRTAYRNETDFISNEIKKQNNPEEEIRLPRLNFNDIAVSSNYQRLINRIFFSYYDINNETKIIKDVRDEPINIINNALINIFKNLKLQSGDILYKNHNFIFSKKKSDHNTEDIYYKNLSAGEKGVFDLVIDIVIKREIYKSSTYCIDEPEAHIHSKLQGIVLRELYKLIPSDSQLWIATHSVGMLNEAENIEHENPGSVIFLDFSNIDFDKEKILAPVNLSKAIRNKFYEYILGDFSKLILPSCLVLCEGSNIGNKRKNFDCDIYSKIFKDKFKDVDFISSGCCDEIINADEKFKGLFSLLDSKTKIIRLIDRDDYSDEQICNFKSVGINVLSKRNIESYLFDDEIIHKLFVLYGKLDLFDKYKVDKENILNNSQARDNSIDNLKSVSGEIYVLLKKQLSLTRCGNNVDAFMRDTLASLITPDTNVYKQLEEDIFGQSE